MAWTDKYANFDLASGLNDGSSEANAWQTPAAMNTGMAAGNRVNLKRQASPYDLTATVTISTAGTATAPIWIRAYATTPGDGGIWECAYNGGGTIGLSFTGNYQFVEGVDFQPGASVNLNGFDISGVGSWCIRCRAAVRNLSTIANCYRCYLSITGNSYIQMAGSNAANICWDRVLVKRIGATTAAYLAFDVSFAYIHRLRNCVFIGNGNAGEDGMYINGAHLSRGFAIEKCRFYNFNHGIQIDEQPDAASRLSYITDNYFETMAGNAVYINAADAGFLRVLNNYYRSCTSGFTNLPVEAEVVPNVALSADALTAPGSDDLTINNAASGGAVLLAVQEDFDPTGGSSTVQPVFQDWRVPDYPAVGNVTEDDTVDGAAGTYHEAMAAEVQSGVQFGAGGTEYTGTLSAAGGAPGIIGG